MISILHLEDDPADSRLIREILRSEGINANIRTVTDRRGFMAALDEIDSFDLFLADYRLPAFDGVEALKFVRELSPDVPFIFVTGALGEERAIETFKTGATDFVLKDRLDRLAFCVRRGLAEAKEKANRRAAEEALAESESRLRLALEGGKMGLWEIDLKNKRSMWNAHQAELLGRPIEDKILDADDFFRHLFPDDARNLRKLLAQVAVDGRDLDCEFRIIRSDNRQMRWLASKGRLFRDASGEPERIIGVNYDITQRKEIEEALCEAGRRKDEFLAMLAHELRNPLGSIRSANQVGMLRGIDDPLLQRGLEIVDRQVVHMTRLLDDLLDVARVSQGKIILKKEPLDLRPVVEHAADAADQSCSERSEPIRRRIPGAPIMVEGDVVRLEQIFGNLFSNALKFCEEGPVGIEVIEESSGPAPSVVVRVIDEGIGIDPEALPRVFDLFMQADQSLARSRGGLGIGLSMVKRLAEMHGGSVSAYSEGLGKGAVFSVSLPLLKPAALRSDKPLEHGSNGRPESAAKSLRILIVDDNADGAFLLGEIARSWGCDVGIANDGPTAIAKALDWAPQVILLDIGMPGMDGFEVARRLRSVHDVRNLRIIAMSGYSDEKMRKAASASGFDDYLVKPVDTDELAEMLQADLLSR